MSSAERLAVLVVEDSALMAQCLARIVKRHGTARIAGTVREAIDLLATKATWAAFVVDLGLPDGSGLAVLAQARTAYPRTPALVLTGSHEPDAINAANALSAEYLVKPAQTALIDGFLRRASRPLCGTLEVATGAWRSRYALSAAETNILLRTVRGESREVIADARESSVLTVQKQVANLLQKTKDASLHHAAERLLREVVLGLSEPYQETSIASELGPSEYASVRRGRRPNPAHRR